MIWIMILLSGLGTYALRASFLMLARQAREAAWHRWLQFAPAAVLAALVVPALVAGGSPSSPEVRCQVLAAALASLVAWRSQNVLLTVVTGMVALWLLQILLAS